MNHVNKIIFGGIRLMRLITVKVPESYIEGLDDLVRSGRYSSRSEAIRIAIRDLLQRELWLVGTKPAKPKRSIRTYRIIEI